MARVTAAHSVGAGDVCPVNREHGRMLVLNGSVTQYCPHQSHDARPKTHPDGSAPRTRNIWPMQFFEREAAAYTAKTAGEAARRLPDLGSIALPELDMEGFDA